MSIKFLPALNSFRLRSSVQVAVLAICLYASGSNNCQGQSFQPSDSKWVDFALRGYSCILALLQYPNEWSTAFMQVANQRGGC